LAAVLTAVDDIHADEIDVSHMEAGIALADHYASEATRLCAASQANADLIEAQRLRDWLRRSERRVVCLRDIYQRGPRSIRDKDTARKLVTILVDHGHLRNPDGPVIIEGHRHRADVWQVVGDY
jgi:hypothetical protein